MNERSFDVIVIGAGPAGEVAAGRLTRAGLEVAIVERELVGGECSFYACMPSKALLRPAQALARRGASRAPPRPPVASSTWPRRSRAATRSSTTSTTAPSCRGSRIAGVTLVRGHGRLDGERRVRVGDEVLVARRAVILAPGTAAALPPIDGLAEARPWTNREATTAGAVPASLLVIGGGPVGCELAQAYRSLGADVTLLEYGERLLPRDEAFAGETIRAALVDGGVEVRLGARIDAARREPGGDVVLTLAGGEELRAQEVLVAAGRRPLTEDLGLETVGLTSGGPIEVGDDLRVPGSDWLYVLGDANGRVLLTHMGKYQARLAADRIAGVNRPLLSDGALSPRVTFTEPQVAAVGHTLASALEAGLDAIHVAGSMSATAGGSFVGRGMTGETRLVVEHGTGRVLGATLVAVEAGESLHAATIAVTAGLTMDQLRHAVPAFPSRSEFWLHLLEDWEKQAA